MKKFICVMLFVSILLISTVSVFAVDWSSTDQTNLQNAANRLVYNGFSAARLLYDINSILSTISSTVSTISSRLFYGDHSITYYVSTINSYMNPIYLRLQDILKATTDPSFNAITGLLGYPTTDSSTGVTTWTSYLRDGNSAATWLKLISQGTDVQNTLIQNGFSVNNTLLQNTLNQIHGTNNVDWAVYNWMTGEDISYRPANFSGLVGSFLSYIQVPVGRLAYVLASEERIEAQHAAAANEEAVVDNFIDSSGSGAASTSDFSSISYLSSGFKNNIASDASVSSIWNIFNSENFGWFSKETSDQLDTSGSGPRMLTRSSYYPTPLLDQKTEDIIKYIGGDNND